ncbi:right-handed parallel beta-helix repeat-containing protein [Leptospira yasudae]|uniref:Right-handed parallel beta-helix repeat-containing protein n=2 Tax=Leptospira yasudae TaxID=2202201 RepID=A0A6N4R179_9LEPT|nr:right-handed parallel beta-helix repeat-containing protein [Leptospira yasudae]TGL83186.1 right-handed parallel beta-helix repeat-containing protein [Leptospira yasudae]TGL87446.1 right-handed parallel beta-helix repeat-containing protein [Leptospira yasudae]
MFRKLNERRTNAMNQLPLRSIISLLTLSILVFSCQNESNGSFYKNIPLGLLHQLSSKVNFFQSATTSNAVVGPTQLIYVSESLGDDLTNDGTSPDPIAPGVGPFKTIEKALLTAKTLRTNQTTANLYAPIKILIRSGRYYLTQPLEITYELSGKGLDSALTITRYANERPIISGGRPVINWTYVRPAGNSRVWVADYPDNSINLNPLPGHENANDEKTDLLHNLWVDDQWAVKARYPKNDSYYTAPENDQGPFWLFAQPGSRLIDSDPYKYPDSRWDSSYVHVGFNQWNTVINWNILNNAEITIYLNDYSFSHYRLKGGVFDPASSTTGGYYIFSNPAKNAKFQSDSYYTRFFLSNVVEQLTNEGEWFLDKVNRKIQYIPKGNIDPNLSKTYASALPSIININGTESQLAEYIVIDGLTFSETAGTFTRNPTYHADAAIHVKWGNKIWVTNSYFNNLSGSGIHLEEGTQWVTVIRNVFSNLGLSGVFIRSASGNYPPFKNVVQGNYIIRTGLLGGMAGILIVASDDNSIFNNQIDRSVAHGIAIPADNFGANGTSTTNGITGNEVTYSALRTSDQGGIYINAQNYDTNNTTKPVSQYAEITTGNWITENRVLQSYGATRGEQLDPNIPPNILRQGADGIFLDDYSSGNLVQLNVVSNATRAAVHINNGGHNKIYQNILANGIDSTVMVNKANSLAPAQSNEFYLNLIPETYTGISQYIWKMKNGQAISSSFSWIDGNMYWWEFSNSWPFNDGYFSPLGNWFNWKANGFDANSGYATQNPGVQTFNGMAIGNSVGGWTSSVGYGPGSGLLTGLRRFAAASNDPATACINAFFGSQYSPIFNVDPKSFYTTCIAP